MLLFEIPWMSIQSSNWGRINYFRFLQTEGTSTTHLKDSTENLNSIFQLSDTNNGMHKCKSHEICLSTRKYHLPFMVLLGFKYF